MRKEVPEGLHARYEHVRPLEPPLYDRPKSCGGNTYCYLENDGNVALASGVANCNVNEQYNKKIGRDISLGRALKSYYARVEEPVSG